MFFTRRRPRHQAPTARVHANRSIADLRDAKPVDLFDAWLFAEAECSLHLKAWCTAGAEAKAAAHAAYSAALDREDRAARVLGERLTPGRHQLATQAL